MVQHEMSGGQKVEIKTVKMVLDSGGKPVRLSMNKPIPHMLEENGEMVVAMPRAHPGVRVQVEVDKDMYERTGLPLGMGVINDEKGQDTADTQG